ncbi:MAG TPA: response regulator [Chloroflexota bacterium]|jgi:CheY-like chemotaxis protein
MKRVVVVEEDPAARVAAAAILHDLDCEVDAMAEAKSALTQRRRTPPDAILISNSLASMPASAFVRTCREIPRLARVPIIVMAVSPRAAIEAIREGAHACIRKPVDTGGVFVALSDVLRQPRRRPSQAPGR